MARDTTRGARGRTRRSESTGARAAGAQEGTKGKKGLLGILLALLALLIIAAILFALLSGDDDKDKAGDGGSARAALTASGTALLPPPGEGLGNFAGQNASGKALTVQSVNGNEGFFVGESADERVYVEWGGDVGEDEASKFQPKQGQKVQLTGPVQKADSGTLAKLKLSGADRQLVTSQGGFVNAETVTESK